MQSNENYRYVMLKSFQPLMHIVELVEVRTFAFKPHGQREACQKKDEEELENSVPGKREHPSEK